MGRKGLAYNYLNSGDTIDTVDTPFDELVAGAEIGSHLEISLAIHQDIIDAIEGKSADTVFQQRVPGEVLNSSYFIDGVFDSQRYAVATAVHHIPIVQDSNNFAVQESLHGRGYELSELGAALISAIL